MTDRLEPLPSDFLRGDTPFRGTGVPSLHLRDYWEWSASCLLDNTTRGVLAEFLVATALQGFVSKRPRSEWDAYDFRAHIGGREVTVEVKSSARVQSWKQRKLSRPQFRVAPTRKWDPATGRNSEQPLRADVYVFCLFAATASEAHAAALDVDEWHFRIAPGFELPDQKSVSWNRLSRFRDCEYYDVRREFEVVAAGLAARSADFGKPR
ncbi:MAG: hypothetical protein OXI79_19300 [Gammaproteobacteria bacterium]|nr:hypothetical protein [Gammaproteobacteria bacterium]